RPLGMRTTRIISEADILPNRAAGYPLVNDTLKNQDWVSPSLNTTADGALYFTVRDLAHWAIGLNHWKIPSRAGLEASWTPVRLNSGGTYPYGFGWQITQQRGYRRISHGGAWQGFRTAIQRYPDFDLTVIVLDNLEQSFPEATAVTIAGILEPRLTPPHMLRRAPSEVKPPQLIDRLLQDIAAGVETTHLTPGLKAFISDPLRESVGRRLKGAQGWTFVGCDPVEGRGISRLGTQVVQICYARGLGAAPNSLVTVLYGADWRAAGFDFYSYCLMTIRWLLAAVHLLALGVGLGAEWARGRALQAPLDVPALRRVFYADTWWGIAAVLWIGTGLLRAFGGYEKGAFYYLHNHFFWAKMGLLAARISFVQAVLVVLMVLAATAMARGYGVPAR